MIVVGERMVDDGAVVGTSGFYVDVTDVIQSDVSTVVSDVAASCAGIEQAKACSWPTYGISADRASEILVWRSQETNIKVRDLADRFLSALIGRISTDTRTRPRPAHSRITRSTAIARWRPTALRPDAQGNVIAVRRSRGLAGSQVSVRIRHLPRPHSSFSVHRHG